MARLQTRRPGDSRKLGLSAMQSSDLVRKVLDSVPDAMVIIDASGSIVFTNHQVSELFGYEPSDLGGQRVEILLPECFRDRHVRHRRNYTHNVRIRPMAPALICSLCAWMARSSPSRSASVRWQAMQKYWPSLPSATSPTVA